LIVMKKICYLFIPLLLLSSCISISFTGLRIGIDKLSNEQKQQVVMVPADKIINTAMVNDGKIYAVTGSQLRDCMQKLDTCLVYTWSPHCKGENCMLLSAVQDYCSANGYKLFVVADYINFEQIIQQASSLEYPMFIANVDYYQTDVCRKCNTAFAKDLLLDSYDASNYSRYRIFAYGNYIKSMSRPSMPEKFQTIEY
jgi:hypothetical protein